QQADRRGSASILLLQPSRQLCQSKSATFLRQSPVSTHLLSRRLMPYESRFHASVEKPNKRSGRKDRRAPTRVPANRKFHTEPWSSAPGKEQRPDAPAMCRVEEPGWDRGH